MNIKYSFSHQFPSAEIVLVLFIHTYSICGRKIGCKVKRNCFITRSSFVYKLYYQPFYGNLLKTFLRSLMHIEKRCSFNFFSIIKLKNVSDVSKKIYKNIYMQNINGIFNSSNLIFFILFVLFWLCFKIQRVLNDKICTLYLLCFYSKKLNARC